MTIAYRNSDSQWNSRVFLCAASFQSAEELFTKMLNFLQVRIKELKVGRGLCSESFSTRLMNMRSRISGGRSARFGDIIDILILLGNRH